jgi:hypothetical protein
MCALVFSADPYGLLISSSSEDQMKDVAEREEFLVPIRIDAEANGVRIKDTFTWNMNGGVLNRHARASNSPDPVFLIISL